MKVSNISGLKVAVAVLVYCIASWSCDGKIIKDGCPGNCRCDIVDELRRVQCIQKNLISIEAAIPRRTDILDLSINYISTLDEDEFQRVHLEALKSLNISYNKLSKIHYYAFRGMGKLKMLDLSYNAITYTHSQWFLDMSNIHTVYLQHNNFFALRYDSVPGIFNSKSLKNLHLANTNMAYIDQEFFVKLPALERLDLSSNSLIQLDVKAINSLPMLQELNIDGNEISCNQELSTYCASRGIKLKGDKCSKTKSIKSKGNKFEKMIAAPKVEEELPPSKDNNSWLLEDFEVDDLDYITSNNYSNHTETKSTTLMTLYSLSPIVSLVCAMVVGLVLGVAIGVVVSYSCTQTRHLIIADATAKRRLQHRRRFPSIRMSLHRLSSLGSSSHSSIQYTTHSPIVSYEQCNSETTPVTPRKTYMIRESNPVF